MEYKNSYYDARKASFHKLKQSYFVDKATKAGSKNNCPVFVAFFV